VPNLEPPFVTEDDLFREVPGMRHGVRSLAPPTVHSISSPSELDDTAPLSSDVRSEERLPDAGKLMHSATNRPSLAAISAVVETWEEVPSGFDGAPSSNPSTGLTVPLATEHDNTSPLNPEARNLLHPPDHGESPTSGSDEATPL